MRSCFLFPLSTPVSLIAMLPLSLLFATACAPVVTLGDGSEGSGAAGLPLPWEVIGNGGGTSGSTNGDSSSGGGDSSSSSSAGGGTTTPTTTSPGSGSECSDPTDVGLPASACTPSAAACGTATSACIATADADGAASFGLRMAQITLSKPAALTHGVVKSVFQSAVGQGLQQCNLDGSATFNWLLAFDTAAGTLTTGGAKPVNDPFGGYSFVDETITLGGGSFAVAPLTVAAPVAAACGLTSAAGDVLMPFYGNTDGNMLTIFPLRALRFVATQISPDHNCIGSFNAGALQPESGCAADEAHPAFVDGGQFESFITLEDADAVPVPTLNQSMCVLLSDNASAWGTGGSGATCKRDANGAILFQGDWCSATNQPATAGCADALRFAGSFAASGTTIH